MENNQHRKDENAAADQSAVNSFSNRQPGQQLPPDGNSSEVNQSPSTGKEQHSDTSRPTSNNETLGTP